MQTRFTAPDSPAARRILAPVIIIRSQFPLSCLHTWWANWYYHFSREMAQGSSFQECFCFLDILLLCTVCSCTQWQCVGASNTNDSSLSHALSSHYSILLHIGNEVLFSVSMNLRALTTQAGGLVWHRACTEQFDEICFVFVLFVILFTLDEIVLRSPGCC